MNGSGEDLPTENPVINRLQRRESRPGKRGKTERENGASGRAPFATVGGAQVVRAGTEYTAGGQMRGKETAMDEFLQAAIEEARVGRDEGGIPIGSVLVLDGKIIGRGHNRRVQQGSVVLHAEMDCLENAGRLRAADYRRAVLYSTLSPCDMCSGAVLLYGIPRVVIGENRTFRGPEDYTRSRGVELVLAESRECRELMEAFIRENPELWNEDIGV
jgi:creatinine deaminase